MSQDYQIGRYALEDFFSKNKRVVFYIPNYQRNYSWQKQQVLEFFNDLYDQTKGSGQHYFGMIMTLRRDDDTFIHEFELIDGQQRIITSIILLVCIRDISHEMKSRFAQTIDSEIFNLDVEANDERRHKIIHDKWNESFFREIMRKPPEIDYEFFFSIKEKMPQNIYQSFYKDKSKPTKKYSKFRGMNASNEADKLLKKAYMTIREEIAKKINDELDESSTIHRLQTMDDYKKFIINFLKKLNEELTKNFVGSKISVKDESKVYTLFNGINNRGLRLSMSDTVKNWIFYHIHKEKMRGIATISEQEAVLQWKEMENHTTKSKLDNYIHHYLVTYHSEDNGKFRHIKKIKSFSIIKDLLNVYQDPQSNSNSATELLVEICSKFENYRILTEPKLLDDNSKMSNRRLKISEISADNIYWIHKLQSVLVYPLLMAGLEKYSRKDFEKLSGMVLKWFFINRTVNKEEAPKLERNLARITYLIMSYNPKHKEPFPIEKVRDELLENFDIDSFYGQIPTMELNDASSTYFLTVIEYHEAKKIPNNSLEHIMPKSGINKAMTTPSGEKMTWLQYIQQQNNEGENDAKRFHKEYKNRLGNLTLLETDLNRSLKSELFSVKLNGKSDNGKQISGYKESNIKITREISGSQWTAAEIDERQKVLAEKARGLWEI